MTALRLQVEHETRYDYGAPVALAHHLAHLQPLEDAYQRLLSFELLVAPQPDGGLKPATPDHLGQPEHRFSLSRPHRELTVKACSDLVVAPRFSALEPEASPPWETLAAQLRYRAGEPALAAEAFVHPSPFVPRLAALRSYGEASFRPGRPVAVAALDLMQRVHADFRYESQSTHIDTPLERVWLQRRGVCQDFAHLAIAVLRLFGLPARYVSGYLLTTAPDGGAPMVGADASHAWLQVWCPETPGVPEAGGGCWLDLDPTNAVVPGAGHVRVAVGRDFGDVTPLRGVIRGGGQHALSVAVTTRSLGPAHELLEPQKTTTGVPLP